MLTRNQKIIFAVNALALLFFGAIFVSGKNYEFLGYAGVMAALFLVIWGTLKKVAYPDGLLWGLTTWGVLHMAGGSVSIGGGKILYELMVLPLIQGEYQILKYDQVVHMFGFALTTWLSWVLLKPYISSAASKGFGLILVVVMAGLGFGAVNEIVEFIATVVVPDTNVGGYINTSLDLIFDLLGGIVAALFIFRKERVSRA